MISSAFQKLFRGGNKGRKRKKGEAKEGKGKQKKERGSKRGEKEEKWKREEKKNAKGTKNTGMMGKTREMERKDFGKLFKLGLGR